MKEPPQESAPSAPPPAPPPSISLARGRLCIVLAALLWSTSGAFTKVLTQPTRYGLDRPAAGAKLDGLQIAFGRALFAGLSLLTLLRRGEASFRPAMIPVAICFTAMNALYVSAMALGSAANAVFLQYTAPVWLALAGVFWLKEPADRRTLLSLVVCMVGVAVIVAGGWDNQRLAAALAVGSGVTYAGVLIGLRLLRGVASRWLTIFNHLFAAAALSPALFFCWKATPSWPQVVTLALYGSLQMGLPYWLVARGLRVVGSQEAGMLTLLEPLFNPLWAFLVFPDTETPPPSTLIGGACILAALAWRYWPTRRARPASPQGPGEKKAGDYPAESS